LKNLKARVATFNLNGKASIWWEDLKNVKWIHEEDLSWERFEKYFSKKYLSEKYFDEKTKEFYELKLGQCTIKEYVSRFLELLRYVPLLHIIFVIPMIVNDVNLSVAFRGVSGLSS
jgi:hypothetical protein